MHKKAKIIFIALIFIFVIGYIFLSMNAPLKVNIQNITKQSLIRDFKETAKFETNEQVSITPPYSSKILFIAEEGTKISKGDLLLELDTQDLIVKKKELLANINALSGQEQLSEPILYDSQLKSLDIAIELAQKQVDNLAQDNEKYKNLYDSGAISKSEYDNVNRAYEDAKKALLLKENEKNVLIDTSKQRQGNIEFYGGQKQAISVQISDIEDKLSNSKIYANSNGIITSVNAKTGGFANMSAPIMEISNSDEIIAVSEVLSSDAMALKENQKVKILQKIGEETIEKNGKIIEIGNYAKTKISSLGLEEQRVEIKISVEDMKNVIVGSDVDVVFETLHIDDVLVISKSSVFEDENNKYVWKVENEKLEKTIVETGRESDYEYEVVSGLKENDIIIVEPNDTKLKSGVRIEINNK